LVAPTRRLEDDAEVLLELTLADELIEVPGSQAGFDNLLDVVADGWLEELVTHVWPPTT